MDVDSFMGGRMVIVTDVAQFRGGRYGQVVLYSVVTLMVAEWSCLCRWPVYILPLEWLSSSEAASV